MVDILKAGIVQFFRKQTDRVIDYKEIHSFILEMVCEDFDLEQFRNKANDFYEKLYPTVNKDRYGVIVGWNIFIRTCYFLASNINMFSKEIIEVLDFFNEQMVEYEKHRTFCKDNNIKSLDEVLMDTFPYLTICSDFSGSYLSTLSSDKQISDIRRLLNQDLSVITLRVFEKTGKILDIDSIIKVVIDHTKISIPDIIKVKHEERFEGLIHDYTLVTIESTRGCIVLCYNHQSAICTITSHIL